MKIPHKLTLVLLKRATLPLTLVHQLKDSPHLKNRIQV